ncbi:MAG: enoyl-CoA hydratase, partial [Chloroflexi bacterium]
ERIHQIALTLENFGKPVIAAVNGPAVGAGLDMALMCDMRFAARSARFAESYVRLGLVPGDGGCFYLPRLVGVARALELLLTGDVIEAIEAERIGMVNRVYDDDQLLTAVYEFATRLAAGPPLVLKMIKQAVYESMRTDLRTSLDLISSHMVVVQSSYDGQEAMAAFREKRTPVFEGR